MRVTQPPRLAAWLFERLASGPNRESLGGDLAEQYRRGRSSAWYWRQVFMALWASTTQDIADHKLTAVRAVILSWMFLIPWIFFTGWLYGSTKFWVMETLIRGSIRLHDVWVIYAAPLLITWCLGSALIGWVVARLEPDCRAGMLFACAVSHLLFAVQQGAPVWRLANAGLPFFASFPVMVNLAAVFFVMPLSLWLGGLLAARQRPSVNASEPLGAA